MKKLTIVFSALMLLTVSFTSCKKDHTCTCTYSDVKTGQITTQATTIHQTKNKAKAKCNEYGDYLQTIGAFNITCDIND